MINKKRLIRLILEVLFYGFIIGIGVNYPYYQRAIAALMVVISVGEIIYSCVLWKKTKEKNKK